MGIVDLFSAEDTAQIKISQLICVLEERAMLKAENNVLLNGIKKEVPSGYILAVLDKEGAEQ